jgi:hypothetical protein
MGGFNRYYCAEWEGLIGVVGVKWEGLIGRSMTDLYVVALGGAAANLARGLFVLVDDATHELGERAALAGLLRAGWRLDII